MSEQNINNEEQSYEIPSNDMSESSEGGGLVGKSSVKEVIEAASGIDPTRFWIVFMVGLVISLASIIMFGGAYILKQNDIKDATIVGLRQELKDCPEKTLMDLKRQNEAIEQLRNNVLYNSSRINEIKIDTKDDINSLKEINKKLKTAVTP